MIVEDPEGNSPPTRANPSRPPATTKSILISTFTSLGVVLVLLFAVRWILPPLLESSRYSWYRGQLRAEHEAAGQQLQNVSLDGLSRVSELVSQRVTPSVVHINVNQADDADEFKGNKFGMSTELREDLKIDGQGSGVIVDSDGYIITNYHVLENGELIDVRLSDDSRLEARIVGIDWDRDLAVLKIDPIALPSIAWGDSDSTIVGTPVWAVGSPFGLHGSITFGILSSKHRIDLSESRYQYSKRVRPQYSDLMQSDVAVNPGNSGGPLVNGRGELIGINTAILGESYRGVSFSIPSNMAKKIYDEIREKAKAPRGWLGVQLRTVPKEILKNDSELEPVVPQGVVVADFAKFGQSPARKAGIRRRDVIASFNSHPIVHHSQLIELISKAPIGSNAQLEIVRDGTRKSIDVEIGIRHVELRIESGEAGN